MKIPSNISNCLCYYDVRNPNGIKNILDDNTKLEDWGLEESDLYPNREDCVCDNCYYGRTRLANKIIELMKNNDNT